MPAKKLSDASVLTANRLKDGAVVFLSDDFTWSTHLKDAQVIAAQSATDILIAKATAQNPPEHVVAPYAIDVETFPHNVPPRPYRLRERIRANGPTV